MRVSGLRPGSLPETLVPYFTGSAFKVRVAFWAVRPGVSPLKVPGGCTAPGPLR